MSFFSFPSQQIFYCIENENEGSNKGKHNFIFEETFGVTCEYCFLPETKANFKPMVKLTNGKFKFLEKTELTKKYFFDRDEI